MGLGGGCLVRVGGRSGGLLLSRCVYSLVNFFVGMLRAIMVNYARFIRDIHRDTFEIWEIHVTCEIYEG